LDLLNAALKKTGWAGPHLNENNWPRQLMNRIDSLDWEKARADVRPFLARERDLDLVKKDVLLGLLK
jgi:hypothetical protein